MCGIAGFADFSGLPASKTKLEAMISAIRHRGPDDSGLYTDNGCGLGHRRLSIIDLSPAGHQPMLTEDGRYAMIYNGEIYNFQEIRARLEREGVSFWGHSDSEVALKSFARWGHSAIAMWHGMFACAIWDAKEKRLHLMRDRFGIKPLYYHVAGKRLLFGSELKALLAYGDMERVLNWSALGEYLHFGTSLGQHTLFEGAMRLLPGHHLTFDNEGLRSGAYADVYELEQCADDYGTAVEKIRGLLDLAVQAHLIADVPVGIFLSGGLDSSAITAFASRHAAGKIATFSAGFDFDKGVNELPRARRVAEHFGTDHHELHIAGTNVAPIIEGLVASHDLPFGDAANIPLYLMSKALGKDYKVILQGDGGDEVFGGYDRYVRLNQQRLWQMLGKLTLWTKPYLNPKSAPYRAMRTMYALNHPDESARMAYLMSQEPVELSPFRVFSADAKFRLAGSDPFRRYREFHARFANLDSVQRMLFTDTGIILPDLYFEKVDRATMACNIEVRVPLLDVELARYVMALPSAYKVRRNKTKSLMRDALRGIVPDDILDAPKTGFGVPFQYWLRTSLAGYMKSVLLDTGLTLFDRPALEQVIAAHVSGQAEHGYLLYKLLNLALWINRYDVKLFAEPVTGTESPARMFSEALA